MNLWNFLQNFFDKKSSMNFTERATGVLKNPHDYRDIPLGSFQKPIGAPDSYDGTGALIEKLPRFDQWWIPACVPHAISKLLMIYIYRKTGQIVKLSPRFGYRLAKMFDGVPRVDGTYPRIAALIATKFGTATEALVPNNTHLFLNEYMKFDLSEAVLADAKKHRLPGFAFVAPNIEAIKEAIFQNGAVTGSTPVGNWGVLPLRKTPYSGLHYTVWYRYEKLQNGDYKIYVDNSWGDTWLSWVANWLFPGRGYFLWSEYNGNVYDIVAFTDIPGDFMDYVKTLPYRFTRELFEGASGLDVKELQKLLNGNPETAIKLEGAGAPEEETSFFGPATKIALMKWQTKNGISPTGYFGPISIRKANERIPKKTLIDALILVESGGNDNAIGDKHLTNKAYGPLQIRKPYIDDVNKKWGTNYKAEDMLGNRELSIKVFEAYMSIYEPNGTDEEKARAHNAGPGWRTKRAATDVYWSKVKQLIND